RGGGGGAGEAGGHAPGPPRPAQGRAQAPRRRARLGRRRRVRARLPGRRRPRRLLLPLLLLPPCCAGGPYVHSRVLDQQEEVVRRRRRGRPRAGEAPEEECGFRGEGPGGHGHRPRQEVPQEDTRHQAELACLCHGLKPRRKNRASGYKEGGRDMEVPEMM
uniref:Uncharacterized protein n=1 Tax=Triticum urartu TaxID=4572 RepID=A0A8R7P756_TRIUA